MSGDAAALPPHPAEHRYPPRDFLSSVATHILGCRAIGALEQSIVIVPDPHAVPDVARALKAAANTAVLLLPRITTLRLWAQDVAADRPVLGDAARTVTLYRALAERGWFEAADLWALCAELGRLFDELTRERVSLPDGGPEFVNWLREAYRAAGGRSLEFEARLIHEMWSAFMGGGGSLDPETAYVAALAHLASAPRAPLHVIAPARWSRAESEFLTRYAGGAEVHVYRACADADDADPCARTLAAAWPAAPHADMRARAMTLLQVQPQSAIAHRLRIAGATSAEHEAQIVDLAVRERLIAGKRRIAVVVQDRITARRARALLERAGVLVTDEAGWAFSTTSAATVLARWLDAVSGGFYHHDLFDLLKSPFAFSDWPREQRQQAVWRLEQHGRKANAIAGIDNFIALAEEAGDAEVKQMLATLKAAARLLDRRRAPLPRWLDLLTESLKAIGVTQGWAADAAGAQLLELIAALREELDGETFALSFHDWRRWLSRELDNASFRDESVDSPVLLTYLGAVTLRQFEAVIIAGADAAHLPGPDGAPAFFNQGVRAQLGLPTRAERSRETEAALAAIVAGCDDVVATWQCVREGEGNLLSPQLERLNAVHELAYGSGLDDAALAARAQVAVVRAEAAEPDVMPSTSPAPRVAPELVPATLSASGYNTLMACPYQFYARYVLRLAELDEVQELIEKGDYGERVHRALADFHRLHPRISPLDEAQAVRALEGCSESAFEDALRVNYLARAWLERWKARIPAYLAWQREREAEGWRVVASEMTQATEIVTPRGRKLRLHGRIDRVDGNEGGATALLDYKTQARAVLSGKAEADGEDVQLPFYALLWGGPVAEALFVGLERDGGLGIPLRADVNDLAAAVGERAGVLYDALLDGASLPAHGVDDVCRYCEVGGLCRRKHWP